MKKEIRIAGLEDLPRAAKEFVSQMDSRTVYAFYGAMGAGKTTFIGELCAALGVAREEFGGSPTFAIINEYRSDTTAELIYHFDLYRLESLDEAFDIGVEDYFDSGAICLIEWPERIEDILPDDTVKVTVRENEDSSRSLIIE